MRILALVVILVAASAPVGASASSASAPVGDVSVPIDYFNGDCRATVLAIEDGGGCSVAFAGTLQATCDMEACDVKITLDAVGTRGTSTPQASAVDVRVIYALAAGRTDPNSLRSERGELCAASDAAEEVVCSGALDRRLQLAEGFGPYGEPCVGVALDAESRTSFAPSLLVTHSATSRGVRDDDTRPIAPMWYVCVGGGTVFVLEDGWMHTPF